MKIHVKRWVLQWTEEHATVEVPEDFDTNDSDAIWDAVAKGAISVWDEETGGIVDAEQWELVS